MLKHKSFFFFFAVGSELSTSFDCCTGFDTFKEEVGITKDSMKRGMSLDVQYDEQDMIKVSA